MPAIVQCLVTLIALLGLSRHTTPKVQHRLENLIWIEFQKIDRSEYQNQHFCCVGQFSFDRTLLRFPVTYRYRLLCRWYADRIIPLQVLSHEAYNAVARNKKRLKGS